MSLTSDQRLAQLAEALTAVFSSREQWIWFAGRANISLAILNTNRPIKLFAFDILQEIDRRDGLPSFLEMIRSLMETALRGI